MMNKFAIFSAAPLVAVAVAKEPTGPSDCVHALNEVFFKIGATTKQQCDAVVEFSRCLGQFPPESYYEQVLFQRQSAECEKFFDFVESPQMRSIRDDLSVTVDNTKDA